MKKLGICKTPGFVQCKIRDLSISGKIGICKTPGFVQCKIRDLSISGKIGICKTPGFVQCKIRDLSISGKKLGFVKPRDLSKRVQCGENQGLST